MERFLLTVRGMMQSTHHMALATLFTLFTILLSACGDEPVTPPIEEPDDPIEWMELHTEDYLEDRAWRRARLEETMWRPDLPYAKKLLENYGLERGGWDLLPVLDFQVAPVYGPESDRPFSPSSLMERRPETREEWLALGERAFWEMPMRRDPYIEWIAQHPEHWEEVGLKQNEDGSLRGFTRYIDPRGRERVGITCGLCHGANDEPGFADSHIDMGRARALYMESRGLDPEPFIYWGPGKLDVTNDNVDDPVAIPNLWGASEQAYFNASGSIRVVSPASAAVRFETQYIINHSFEARPDRALPWALAMFMMSLQAPETTPEPSEALQAGEALFMQKCAGCHIPERGYSGELIPASALTSDPAISQSITRGTGFYRAPSLLGLSRGGPYLHDLSASTLDDLLLGGHPTGETLDEASRARLILFLETL